jgi:hypothetical protein
MMKRKRRKRRRRRKRRERKERRRWRRNKREMRWRRRGRKRRGGRGVGSGRRGRGGLLTANCNTVSDNNTHKYISSITCLTCQDSSVGIAAGYGLDDRGVEFTFL